jgi:hypothetical protein
VLAVEFGDIFFGYASAERERSQDPRLLLDGYYDLHGQTRAITAGPEYLVLGYKGSGKTMLAERLELLGEQDPTLFVTNVALGDFPFAQFKKIVSGEADAETRYPAAWSWLLLLLILNSLSKDESSPTLSDPRFLGALSTLKKLGLMPSPSIRDLVLVSSKQSFKAKLSPAFEAALERTFEGQDLWLLQVVNHLKLLVSEFKTDNRHLLIIDGLDDVLTAREVQYQSLASLIREVGRINSLTGNKPLPAKVVVLCRTDLFERLPDANKNKLRQDFAVNLDWYHDPGQPGKSHLMSLAQLRARLSGYTGPDVLRDFLPSRLDGTPTRRFLFEQTRHTPRDFFQLLTYLQRYATKGPIEVKRVFSGLREYSFKYFLPEIKDELAGYLSPDDTDLALDLLGSMHKKRFTFEELEAHAASNARYERLDLHAVIDLMFECSLVGNVLEEGRRFRTQFKFRNQNVSASQSELFQIHPGSFKALGFVNYFVEHSQTGERRARSGGPAS